jgi:DEAD/DEAH box helicase domain-containing protein
MKDVLRKKLRLNRESVSGVQLAAFYNGMLAVDERKQVISAIKRSDVHLVIATNALEVGIDIGDLSFAILSGYPGSKAAFSQQIGRVGRKGEGVAVMLFEDEPLQQYYMQNPKIFLEKPPEVVRIDPKNESLLKLHLQYLQEELGRDLTIEDILSFVNDQVLADLLLREIPAGEIGERCNLRSGSTVNYKVVTNKQHEVLLDNVDEWTALRDFHEGAVYWNANEKAYRVDSINRNKHEIIVAPIRGELEYYTQSMFKDSISIADEQQTIDMDEMVQSTGVLNIKRSVFGFAKNYFGKKIQEKVALDNPLVANFESEGFWIVLGEDIINELKLTLGSDCTQEKLDGSIRAAEHVLLSVIPDTIICDGNDISSFSGLSMSGFGNNPVIGFFGNQSGGMGVTKAIGEHLARLSVSALNLLETCSCVGGCPSCIQNPGKDNDHLSKAGGRQVLKIMAESVTSNGAEA